MQALFSPQFKYSTWRKLWVALAKGEQKLGLPITDKQIEDLEAHVDVIDFQRVTEIEHSTRHDVMAHLHAFGECCPDAKGILHMGATSSFVTDNTDIIQIRKALNILKAKCLQLLQQLDAQAKKHAALATLSYTHLQPAQPTTVGKRICLWLQDLLFDFDDLIHIEEGLHLLGVKGATGTQASFMTLFDQDTSKIEQLDQYLAKEMGFKHVFIISSQTYTRKQDMRVLSVLEGIAASLHKCATDLRLLAHLGEMKEEAQQSQVGSSAMPHKQNPIYAERICGLARFLISLASNGAYTLSTQWLERSLDDSANRRLVLPEAFLTADAILNLGIHLFSHLHVDSDRIKTNLEEQLPLLSLENILMSAVKKGKDRQEVHERLRVHSRGGKEFIQLIENDPIIGLTKKELETCFTADTGRAKEQVDLFLKESVEPRLKEFSHLKAPISNVNV